MSCGNPFKHAIEDVKETFSKSCGVPIQGTIGAILFLIMKLILMRSITRMNACSLVTA